MCVRNFSLLSFGEEAEEDEEETNEASKVGGGFTHTDATFDLLSLLLSHHLTVSLISSVRAGAEDSQ